MPTIQFNDARLRRAVEKTKSVIGERSQKLDNISADIKELERYLEQSGVGEEVRVRLGGGATVLGEVWEVELSGEAAAEDVSEFLVWQKLPDHDRWRIMYLKQRQQGFFSDVTGMVINGEIELIEHRPLIETPASVRLRASGVLPDLLRAIAQNVKGPNSQSNDSTKALRALVKALAKSPQTGEKANKG